MAKGRSSRNGQGAVKAVEVLGEKRAHTVASLIGCPLGSLECRTGGNGHRWIRVTVPPGVAAFFDHSAVSVRAGTPQGIVERLRRHPARSTTAPATG